MDSVHKFGITGSVEDASRDGRPFTMLTSEKLQQIENVVNENPFLSVRSGALQTEINRETYRLAQQTLEFKCYHPQFVTDLSDEDFDRRNEFCETTLEKFNSDRNFVDHILWTEEVEFKLNGTIISIIAPIGLMKIYIFKFQLKTQSKVSQFGVE